MSCVICGGEDGQYGIGLHGWEMEPVATLCDPCVYRLVPGLEDADREREAKLEREREEMRRFCSPEEVAKRARKILDKMERDRKRWERERRADERACAKFDAQLAKEQGTA